MHTAIVNVMKEAYDRNWITTRDGNISVTRKDQDWFYITPSGNRKNVLRVEDLVKIRFDEDGLYIPEGTKPSAELEMHHLINRKMESNTSVVHLHPTHIVAAAFAGFDMKTISEHFPELNRYTRVGDTVPVIPFGTDELAQTTLTNLGVKEDGSRDYDIVVQKNHGVCAVAGNPWSAFEHIERLDHVCKIVLASGVSPADI